MSASIGVERRFAVPVAREAVMSTALSRPDWTTSVPRDPRLLWLDKNENPDPELLAVTREVLAGIPSEALCTYPECRPLYDKLSHHVGVDASHLLLCAGSDGVIRSVFEAFVSPGDVVLHTEPTFAMYAVYSQMYGARAVPISYERGEHGPVLGASVLVGAIRQYQPRVVCLPNPDSPTGTVFSPSDMRAIILAAGDVGALILVDEAYHPFHEETVVPWVDEFPHLVVARTFAKAWGLAGLRTGYAVAGPGVTRLLHKVRPMYEVNTVAVFTLERMLDREDVMRASVRRLNEGRDVFRNRMLDFGLETPPTHGNFMHVAFGPAAAAVHEALADVVLYRRDFAHPSLSGFTRFSATTKQMFQPIVLRIERALSSARG